MPPGPSGPSPALSGPPPGRKPQGSRETAKGVPEGPSFTPAAEETVAEDGPGAEAEKIIRVIEVRRHLTDPTSAGQEELTLVLGAAREVPALAMSWESLKAFLDLARILQGPLSPLLAWPPPPAATEVLDSILARDAFANPAVRPVVAARGAAADTEREEEDAGHRIRTRAATRVRAIWLDGYDAALASEEPADIAGFAVDPLAAGTAVTLALGSSAFLGLDAYAASGAYPAPVFAATGPVRPPEHPVDDGAAELPGDLAALRKNGFALVAIHPPTTAAPEILLRHARAAVNFYLSGAAAATSLARLAAAVRGEKGAPPDLLAAVGPISGALSDLGGFIVATEPEEGPPAGPSQGPTWRDAADEERLRYLMGRLSKTEPIAADDPGTWAFDVSPLNDLFRVGAFGVYLYALTEGRDSARLDEFLELSAIRHAKATHLEEIARRATVATSRARLYVTIIEDKFGSARARVVLDALRTAVGSRARGAPGGSLALPSDAVQVNDPDAVLALLSKREREIVEVEYENRRQEWEASVNNKCPHVRLARRLRAATSAEEALAALNELAKYFAPDAGRRKVADAVADAAGRDGGKAPPAGETQWLLCRNCGFRTICPHVRDRVRLEARRAPYDELRTRLLKYAVRVRAGEADTYTYYCRICSERLAEIIEEDRTAEILGRFGDLDAGLRTKIWTIALVAARNVRFPAPTDERQFASAAAVVVYPLLMAAEEAVAKKGRRRKAPRPAASPSANDATALGEEDIDPRTELYAVLFVYAYILSLVHDTQGLRGQEVGFVGVKPGAKEGTYAERMLRLVAEEHRGLLSQIEDITPEYIKARFIEAYRLVRKEGAGPLATANPEEELATQTTTIDPIYRYAAAVARVAGDLPLERAAGPAEARREFETVLGASLPAIVKTARENAKDPALAPLYLRRSGAEVPAGGSLDFLVKDPRVNLYANLYEPKAGAAGAEALKAFRQIAAAAAIPAPGIRFWIGAADSRTGAPSRGLGARKHNGRHEKHEKHAKARGRNAVGLTTRPEDSLAAAERGYFYEAYRLFALYTKGLTSREAFDAYQHDLAEVRRSEDGLRVVRALASLKPYYDFGFIRTQQYVPVDVPITALYDEDGLPHDWSKNVIYYYAPAKRAVGGAKTREPRETEEKEAAAPAEKESARELVVKGGPAGVKKALESGELTPGMALVDLECSVCHTRMSRVADLDSAKAWKSLRAASEIDSFFVFYESRCPEGELHDWDETKCRKCGLESAVVKEVAGGRASKNKRAREYYDRHAAKFAQERREAREKVVEAGPAREAPPEVDPSAVERAKAWRPDYTVIVRAAELAGVTPATIEAIGAMEGREYEAIVEGRGAPPPPTAPSDPRIYAADAEVRLFLSDYSILRNFVRARKPPQALVDLVAAAGVPKHEYAGLAGALPDVGAGYNETFAAVVRFRPPADAYAFAIQSLCRFVLEVANLANAKNIPDWAARLAGSFAKQELQTIMRSQKLFSKPGSFNWAIFETGDDIVPDQVGDVGEDVLEELLGEDAEEAPDDPFSGENMDYDTTEDNPNNEPD